MYSSGDTGPFLCQFLSNINQTSSVHIPFIQGENVFCFDSESFRYLALLKSNIKVKGELADYERSWNESAANARQLVEYVKQLRPLNVQETVIAELGASHATQVMQLVNHLAKKCQELSNSLSVMNIYHKSEQITQTENALEQVFDTVQWIVELAALIAVLASKKSISVFNDDLEAYLEERVREEQSRSMMRLYQSSAMKTLVADSPDEFSMKEFFKELHTLYLKVKSVASAADNLETYEYYEEKLFEKMKHAESFI